MPSKTLLNLSSTFDLTLPSELEIQVTRLFDAPRELLFEVLTRPEHIRHWWGCSSSTMTTCEMDCRVGGNYRFVLLLDDGQEFGFRGEIRELDAPEKMVVTEIYEPLPNCESLVTTRLTGEDDKTRLTITMLHQTQEQRDGRINSNVEFGMRQSYDALDELLAALQ